MSHIDTSRFYRLVRPWLIALVLAAAVVAVSVLIEPDVQATLDGPAPKEPPEAEHETASRVVEPAPDPRSSLRPYRGLGTWIDIYDDKNWRDPVSEVKRMAAKGVQTLFLETANYRIKRPLWRPDVQARFIDAAHVRGIDVVGWYVPSFADLRRDLRRVKAALDLETENGERFDSFAIDIESTVVRSVERRNRRMLELTRRIRREAGTMRLAAITPDPIGSLYWPGFPYKEVGRRYEVIMPMGYFTYRTSGARNVGRHVAAGIKALRSQTDSKVHYIGGLSKLADRFEVRSYARTAVARSIMGGSLYDFRDTDRAQWHSLQALRNLRPSEREGSAKP